MKVNDELIGAVLANLTETPTPYQTLAETLGADPWDALDACVGLVKMGYAAEDAGMSRDFYRVAGEPQVINPTP